MSDSEIVKEKLNIVDLISRYVDLKPAGSNMKGLCPFHQEKSPSFMVNPSLQIYKCFGCGKGGDIYNFIQEVERVDFPEALKLAAEMVGVELKGSFKKDEKLEKKKERMYKANEITAKFFHHLLTNHKIGKSALEYSLDKRKLTSKELKNFLYGYAPDGYENLKSFLLKKGFTEEELIETGLLVERDGSTIDKFRNRLMQPIFDLKGNIVAFSGRYLGDFEGAPKYLNSPESVIYKKNELLYGLYQGKESIRKKKFVIIVEGNIDIASSHKVGVENIVAPLGTSFTSNQARLLKRFTEELYFAFDTDSAGVNAVVRGLKIAEDMGLQHKVIDLGEFGDVDDLIRANGDNWEKAISKASNTVDYLKKVYSKNLDLGTVDGKNDFKRLILPVLKSLKDDVQKSHYTKEISLLIEIPQENLSNEINSSKTVDISAQIHEENESEEPNESENISAMEKYLLALIVQGKIFEDANLLADDFKDKICREVFEVLLKTKKELNSKALDELSSEAKSLYGEVTMVDVPDDIQGEYKEARDRIRKKSLQSKILHVRTELAKDPENMEPMQQLKELLSELNSIH